VNLSNTKLNGNEVHHGCYRAVTSIRFTRSFLTTVSLSSSCMGTELHKMETVCIISYKLKQRTCTRINYSYGTINYFITKICNHKSKVKALPKCAHWGAVDHLEN